MASTRSTLRAAALGSAIAVGALALMAAPTAANATAAPAVSAGHMIPAVAIGPHYRSAGTARGSNITFPCQTTSPAQCYGPKQIRHAYGYDKLLAKGIDGRGSTIVIVDAYSAPSIRTDLHNFDQAFGLPDTRLNIIAPQGLTKFDYNDANQVGWSAEISLDVEWAHAIAPKATIDLVLAKTNDDHDIEKALQYVAVNGLGDVVSQSYGQAERCSAVDPKAEHQVFEQMNHHGTTVFASSGDFGAAQPSCNGSTLIKSASTPASDPDVTGVGGTSLFANGSTGAYGSEVVWNEPAFGPTGGGSGLSTLFSEPSFQRGVQSTGHRSVPDVSYNAAINEGVIVAWSEASPQGLFYVFGGTSSGSPQWAATAALAKQVAGHRLGDLNPAIYGLGRSSGTRLFHDILKGNTSVTFQDAKNKTHSITGDTAHGGWDFATGFGSPKADLLVPALGDDD